MKCLLYMTVVCLVMAGCGSNLDLSGKGAKTSCLYIQTDSLKVVCACSVGGILQLKIYENKGPKQYYGRLLYKQSWDVPQSAFVLPVPKDSIAGRYIQVDLNLGGSNYREHYEIDLRPGGLDKNQRISARFFGH